MKYLRPSLFCFSAVLLIALLSVFNHSVISIHLNELSSAMDELNRAQQGINTVDILFKYEINRRLYSGTITEAEYDREELKTISILTEQEKPGHTISILDYISVPAINGLRLLLGKPAITLSKEQKRSNAALSLAFYHENNRRFRDAQTIYSTFNETTKNPPVLLHEGYCLSLLGNYENACNKLNRIIQENRNEEIAATAAILLMYITDFKQESDRLMNSNKTDDIDTVMKLVQLNSFNNAEMLLNQLETADVNDETKAKIAYCRGRLLEENGEKSEALEVYQELILEYYRYEAAKNANRRLLVMSVNRSDRKILNALAVENNELLQDETFNSILELNESVGIQTKLSEDSEYLKENVPAEEPKIDVALLEKLQKESKERREALEQEVAQAQRLREHEEEEAALQKKKQSREQQRKAQLARERQQKLQRQREAQRKQAAAKRAAALAAAKKAAQPKKKIETNGNYSIEYYRDDGKIQRIDQFSKTGKKTGYLKYVYDKKGNRIRIDTYDENNELVEYY